MNVQDIPSQHPLQRLWQQFEGEPQVAAEESIPLRILVQLLVFVGIGATDAAASTTNSLWAIPLSAIGATWAYFARYRRNLPVKFCIAIAMIAVLVVFLNDIIGQNEDTKLLLARLLIQLQVLHSFDLPRRKDLGYSTTIGMILLGVAGTLSQTTIFGLWLVLFLAIALPVLVLDHRSRLGIDARSFRPQRLGLSPVPLLGLFAISLALGLTIFTLLPRLPGFQLRNFPVSANINIQRQIPRGGIINPGRQPQGQAKGGQGGNDANNDGIPDGDPLLPPLFAPEIDETQGYQSKPQVVMRVRSQAELFWRVMSYDEYTGKGWRISRNDPSQIRTLRRSPFNYEFYVPPAPGAVLRAAATKDVVQTYTIVSENFPNLIPAASVPYRLYFPSEEVDFDAEGSLRAPGPLPVDLTYTIISAVPYRNETALRQASLRYPVSIRRTYLKLPETFSPRVQAKVIQILAAATNAVGDPIDLDNPYDKALYLTQHLKQRYQLIETAPFDSSQGDLVSQFLARGGGPSSHFATTLAIALRAIGIPARYAVGFAPGQFNAFTGLYEVKNTDAISLVEVFFPGYGWMAFDPVPGRPLFPPTAEVDRTFDVLQRFWQWVAGFLPSPLVGFFAVVINGMLRALGNGVVAIVNWMAALGWAGFIVAIAIVFGLGLTGWGIWQIAGWWVSLLLLQRLAPPERAYTRMVRWLSERGLPKSPAQTPQEYAQFVATRLGDAQARAVFELTAAYQDWRYGDRAADPQRLQALWRQLSRRPRPAFRGASS